MKKIIILAIVTIVLISGCSNKVLTPEQKAKRAAHWSGVKTKNTLGFQSEVKQSPFSTNRIMRSNSYSISIDGTR